MAHTSLEKLQPAPRIQVTREQCKTVAEIHSSPDKREKICSLIANNELKPEVYIKRALACYFTPEQIDKLFPNQPKA